MDVSDDELETAMASCSNWGRWGNSDELGTLNFISPEKVRDETARLRAGVVVSCSRVISPKISSAANGSFSHFMMTTGESAPDDRMSGATDWFGMAVHGEGITHLDSHSHVFWRGSMYNGRPARLVTAMRGSTVGGVDASAGGIVTRGVLADLPHWNGATRGPYGGPVEWEDVLRSLHSAGLELRTGDALLVRTGRDSAGSSDTGSLAGLDPACLPALHRTEIALLCSDGGNDVLPPRQGRMPFPIHTVGIVAMGLWLIDNAYLEDLAVACRQATCWEFLFTVAPLRLKNCTGSPVNPIAIV